MPCCQVCTGPLWEAAQPGGLTHGPLSSPRPNTAQLTGIILSPVHFIIDVHCKFLKKPVAKLQARAVGTKFCQMGDPRTGRTSSLGERLEPLLPPSPCSLRPGSGGRGRVPSSKEGEDRGRQSSQFFAGQRWGQGPGSPGAGRQSWGERRSGETSWAGVGLTHQGTHCLQLLLCSFGQLRQVQARDEGGR